MAFNIATFKANALLEQGARPSLFSVRIPSLPPGVFDAKEQVELSVLASSLPSSIVEQIEIPYMGRRIKTFGERVFENWRVTVYNDESFEVRNMFESWSNKINMHVSNRYDSSSNQGNLGDFKVDNVEVLQYGKAGPGDDSGVIRSYIFYGLWPTQISSIDLNWGQTNQLEMFDVVFSADYWIPGIVKDGYQADIDYQVPASF